MEGSVLSTGLDRASFQGFLKPSISPQAGAVLGGESMQSGQWSLFLVDLIGAGAVVVALAYGIFFRRHIRKMEQLDD